MRISDLVLVGLEDHGVTPALAVVGARDVPEIVATHHVKPAGIVARDCGNGEARERQLEAGGRLAVLGEAI